MCGNLGKRKLNKKIFSGLILVPAAHSASELDESYIMLFFSVDSNRIGHYLKSLFA
jgi:hypothetical protein